MIGLRAVHLPHEPVHEQLLDLVAVGQPRRPPVGPGQRVVIVEDVTTTGGSSLVAIDRAQGYGLVVERVITVIDRLAGAQAAFAARGIPLDSLVTTRDLGIDPDAK